MKRHLTTTQVTATAFAALPPRAGVLLALFIAMFLGLSGCSDQPRQESALEPPLCLSALRPWAKAAGAFFGGDGEHSSAIAFAASIKALLVQSAKGCADDATGLSSELMALSSVVNTPAVTAAGPRAERERQRLALLLVHQMSLFGDTFLNPHESRLVEGLEEVSRITASAGEFIQARPFAGRPEVSVYAADHEASLFAYGKTSNQTRMYLIFNLGFDTQEIPLPLGFMSSTKISLWRSDDTEIRSFVTKAPLFIKPLTAAIIVIE